MKFKKIIVDYDDEKRFINSINDTLLKRNELFNCDGISCKDCKLLDGNDDNSVCLTAEFTRSVRKIVQKLI